MYKRFIRWASDRLADDGIIGFVSNSVLTWMVTKTMGFVRCLREEFNDVYVGDLT